MGSLRRRGVSVVGVVLVTWVVGVPTASAGLVEEVVEAGKTVVEDATSSLPNVLPPVTEPAPVVPSSESQVPVNQAPVNPPEVMATTPSASHSAPAQTGGATEVASPDPGLPSTDPASHADSDGIGAVARTAWGVAGADRSARVAGGSGAAQSAGVAERAVAAAASPRGLAHPGLGVALAQQDAVSNDTPASSAFDPVSLSGGMGLLLTMATCFLALVGLLALFRLVVGEEFRSTLRWHH